MDNRILKISVICPTYNTPPDLLHAAVQSVISAAGVHLHEFLLVDDQSTDIGTLAAIDAIAASDPRVIVIRQANRAGTPSAGRNAGIERATGDWISFIDHDDLWMPDRMDAVLEVLQAYPDAGWIAANYQSLYPDGTTESALRLSDSCPGETVGDGFIRLDSPALTECLIGNAWLHLGASLIRTKFLRRLNGFYEGFVYYHEDCILFTRLSVITSCYFVNRDVYMWRRHRGSLMRSPLRLTKVYAAGWKHARQDPLLRAFMRETRWVLYGVYKGLAVNNLTNGFSMRALGFAFRAWLSDPREMGTLALFIRLMLRSDSPERTEMESRYSTAERFEVGT